MAERKKVLFINYSLHSGGIEKSLVTILNLFDYSRYDVDLQLFANEGLFLGRVPSQVRLLPPLFPPEYRLNVRQAFPKLLTAGNPGLAFGRLRVSVTGRHGTMGERLGRMWNVERGLVRTPKTSYDAAVAFMEGQPIYYNVEKVRSRVKIGFIHGDYEAMGLCRAFDRPYVEKLDALCTVSDSCLKSLCRTFPESAGKCHTVCNILSESFLHSLAEKGEGFSDGYRGLRVLTIARLSPQKGLDLAVPAVAALRREGVGFRWYVIGVGPEEARLKSSVSELGLGDCVFFLGEKANPYPYLAACDVYLQPSRFEGKSIAVDEAMAFHRPIVLTDFSTAADQIDSGRNGLIVPMTPEGVKQGLGELLLHKERREALTEALAQKTYSNENELQKLYRLIGGGSAPHRG